MTTDLSPPPQRPPGRPTSTPPASSWPAWASPPPTSSHAPSPASGADLRRVHAHRLRRRSATAPAGSTAPTGTASWTSGPTGAWTRSPPRRSAAGRARQDQVVARRNARGGRSAAEHLIAALRCLYRHAEDDELIDPADNPARKVAKPRRLPSTRRAVRRHPAGRDQPHRRHHRQRPRTGQPAAAAAHRDRLPPRRRPRPAPARSRPDQCLICLREKGETVRWQPVSPTLMATCSATPNSAHAPPTDNCCATPTGDPITRRRYDHLWDRIGTHLPWVATQQITPTGCATPP